MANFKSFDFVDTKSQIKKKRAKPKKRKKQEESSDSEDFDETILDDNEEMEDDNSEGEAEKDQEERNEMIEEILEFMQDANIGKGRVTLESAENETFTVGRGSFPSSENRQDLLSTSSAVS